MTTFTINPFSDNNKMTVELTQKGNDFVVTWKKDGEIYDEMSFFQESAARSIFYKEMFKTVIVDKASEIVNEAIFHANCEAKGNATKYDVMREVESQIELRILYSAGASLRRSDLSALDYAVWNRFASENREKYEEFFPPVGVDSCGIATTDKSKWA